MVARQPHKLEVDGSNPSPETKDEMTETLRSDTWLPLAGLGKRVASAAQRKVGLLGRVILLYAARSASPVQLRTAAHASGFGY